MAAIVRALWLVTELAVRNFPVNAHGHYRFSRLSFCLRNLANLLWLSLKETLLKKEEYTYLFVNYAGWNFLFIDLAQRFGP